MFIGVDDQSPPTELADNSGAITKYWEVESVQSQITDVQGCLKKNLVYGKEVLHAPPPVLDCIENGYWLPLKFIPPAYFQENHKSAMSHRSFVDEAIKGLLSNRCAMRVEERPYVCSPLSVVSKSMGNLHLVLNL